MSQGANSYQGFGYGRAAGIPGPITNYLPMRSETFDAKVTIKPDPDIQASAFPGRGRAVKLDVKGGTKTTPSSENTARLIAHIGRKVVTTTLTAGVYQHVITPLKPTDSTPATYRDELSWVVYRDDGSPITLIGGKVNDSTLSTKENDWMEEDFNIVFENRSNSADAVAGGSNNVAFTGVLVSRGTLAAPTSTDDIYVKVTTGGALDGTAKVKVKKGSGTTYDGPEYAVVADQWFRIFDETGADLGPSYENPFEIAFHKALVGDVLTANDVWTIASRRAIVTPTYPARRKFSDAMAVLLVGGTRYVINNWSLKRTKKKDADFGSGSIGALQVLDNDEWMCELDFDRSYVDRNFVDAVESGASAAVSITLTGDRIGSTSYRESRTITATMEYADAGTTVSGPGVLKEKVKLRAFDDGSSPFFQEVIVNSMSAL